MVLIEYGCAVLAVLACTFFLGVVVRRAGRERRVCAACGCDLRRLHRMQWAGRWYCLSCYSQIMRGCSRVLGGGGSRTAYQASWELEASSPVDQFASQESRNK